MVEKSVTGNNHDTGVKEIKIGVIPGDGIGPEVISEALKVFQKVTAHTETVFRLQHFDFGAQRYLKTGEVLPESEYAQLKEMDAILLGAVGDPALPSGLLERGLLLKLRFDFDHYVNLRPAKYYDGVFSPLVNPQGTDFVVVREGTEGLYCGNGGVIRLDTPQEIATEVSVNTAYGVERVVRFAFEQAMARRQKLTLVHKHNVLVHAGHLWRRTVERIGQEFSAVETEYLHVDAATIHLVTDPQRFDVIVTDNLFGDILTDEAGAITGGIGLAASANLNPTRKYPSMFEPVHGSAPDIAGKQLADPTAAILSVALMFDFLGFPDLAKCVEDAVEQDLRVRAEVEQTGGKLNRATSEIGTAIASLTGAKNCGQ
ncbi:3-isopropylmalate dehydrogenase [Arcanobacterium hippocoleae]|uniref:3-isopropylmalate dehydrogenase n=1 Tax=Arcanobacterium hippocoleae TaxID=149017 RepID=A0ABU1T1D7_9ACTO|nr:3-isopropylmalate dehydrogenase [Arcanobacterium hippocoleae]MDR6939188.1 3-isopropylmalate dehydrogenase [Arcanobacterium hippocoleae]